MGLRNVCTSFHLQLGVSLHLSLPFHVFHWWTSCSAIYAASEPQNQLLLPCQMYRRHAVLDTEWQIFVSRYRLCGSLKNIIYHINECISNRRLKVTITILIYNNMINIILNYNNTKMMLAIHQHHTFNKSNVCFLCLFFPSNFHSNACVEQVIELFLSQMK